jgi:hypothetical protein
MQKGKRPGGAASLEGRGAINLLVRAQAAGAWSWHQKGCEGEVYTGGGSSTAAKHMKTETP